MNTKERQKQIAQLAAERAELERTAAEREKQAQRLQGTQKNSAQLEARGLRQKANEVARRLADLTEREPHDDERG